jgi:hypothetical protein
MADGKKYYAIGFGLWVELRSSLQPPKAVKTSVKVIGKERYLGYDKNGASRFMYKKVPTTISYTVYEGGKVLGAIQGGVMRALIGNAPAKDSMATLTRTQMERLAGNKKDIKL